MSRRLYVAGAILAAGSVVAVIFGWGGNPADQSGPEPKTVLIDSRFYVGEVVCPGEVPHQTCKELHDPDGGR